MSSGESSTSQAGVNGGVGRFLKKHGVLWVREISFFFLVPLGIFHGVEEIVQFRLTVDNPNFRFAWLSSILHFSEVPSSSPVASEASQVSRDERLVNTKCSC